MLLYRYRPYSELSMKELIYDEIFFASTSENNDPYDGKAFIKFDGTRENWDRLIRAALPPQIAEKYDSIIGHIVDYIVAHSPLYIDELFKVSAENIAIHNDDVLDRLFFTRILEYIKEYIKMYIPAEQYFVSFSKENNVSLMWSHYASSHSGYCLVFRIADRKLYQSPFWKKTNFSHITPNGIASQTSFQIGDSFVMKDIKYVSEPQYIDGFLCFPPNVVGYDPNPDVMEKHMHDFNNVYLQKHTVWKDEKEVRILLSSGPSWLAGEQLSLSPHQRLFHYDSNQLVGIIFGTKMPNDQRKRIREIIQEKVSRWHEHKANEMTLSDFVFFEESLSESNRVVKIDPIEILTSYSKFMTKDHPSFENTYHEWRKGWTLHYSGDKCTKIQIK